MSPSERAWQMFQDGKKLDEVKALTRLPDATLRAIQKDVQRDRRRSNH